MRCSKCNADNPQGAPYCKKCQTSLSLKIRPSPKRICPRCSTVYKATDVKYCTKCQCELIIRNKGKGPLIILASIGTSLVLVFGILFALFLYPIISFNSAIENGDTAKLVSVFRSHPNVMDDSSRKMQYRELIIKQSKDFLDEIIDYNVVTADFDNFETINKHLIDNETKDITHEQKDRIERIQESRDSYQDAESFFEAKLYQNAESDYSSVIEEDIKYFELAQDKLNQITDIKYSFITEADSFLSLGKYDEGITSLSEGLKYFEYDSYYAQKYTDGIVSCVEAESDELIEKNCFFANDGKPGAFNIVYNYLSQDRYSDNKGLQAKLIEIAEKSQTSELASASERLNLTDRNDVLDSCAIQAAKDYINDTSIQNDSSYVVSLCRDSKEVQDLIDSIPKERQVSVAMISSIAMSAYDFVSVSKSQTDKYKSYVWDYTGVGRYYDEKTHCFGWATIIIYETE